MTHQCKSCGGFCKKSECERENTQAAQAQAKCGGGTPPHPQAAAPTHRTTGFMAPVDRYAVPVLFNPYTGEPRDVRDVQSDPQGILIVPPGKVEMLAAKALTPTGMTDAVMDLAELLGNDPTTAEQIDPKAWQHLLTYVPAVEPVGHIYTINGVQHCTIEKQLEDCALYTSPQPGAREAMKLALDELNFYRSCYGGSGGSLAAIAALEREINHG